MLRPTKSMKVFNLKIFSPYGIQGWSLFVQFEPDNAGTIQGWGEFKEIQYI